MKKITLMFVIAFAMLFIGWDVSYADWYLYDNFDDGSEIINPNRWDIQNDTNISITIEDGRAKFVHNPNAGVSNSSFLVFNQSPESIKAVKLKLSVMGPCTGDVRGRVAGWFGKFRHEDSYEPYSYLWSEMSLETDKEVISGRCYMSKHDFSDYHKLFWGKLWTELIYENEYEITISLPNEQQVTYSMVDIHEPRGKMTFTPPKEVFPTDDHFKGIGTISETGEGGCVVFFDEVYVLRDEDCQDINLVHTYTLPFEGMFPHGLAFDGANFWVVNFNPGEIYKLQLNEEDYSSVAIDTIDMTGEAEICMGLTFEGKNLWVPCSNWTSDRATIYNIDQSGKVKKSFPAPGGDSTGLTFDGKYLWNGDFTSGIHKIETNGKLIATYPSPGPEPEGLAFDGEHLWHSDVNTNRIYKIDTSGNVICSYKGPGSYPLGLTFDGTYLWVLDTDGLYQMDINAQ